MSVPALRPAIIVVSLATLVAAASPVTAACWLEHGINPVLSPAGGASQPSVLQDATLFAGAGPAAEWKAWYAKGEGASAVLAHATSADGLSWTEVTDDLGLGVGLTAPRVVHDADNFDGGPAGPRYKMWASDVTRTPHSIRHFTSADGINWTNEGIVIDGADHFEHIHDLAVVYQPAGDGSTPVASRYLGFASKSTTVMFFSSPDGVTWTQRQAFTLDAWHPAVLPLGDGTIRLWASATGFSAPDDDVRIDSFELRPLPDGSGWEHLLLQEGTFETTGAAGTWNEDGDAWPAVVYDGKGLHLYRAGRSAAGALAVGRSSSQVWKDGDRHEPIGGARHPEVLTDVASFAGHGLTARFKLWSTNPGLGVVEHATSSDGDKWTFAATVAGLAAQADHFDVTYDPDGFGDGPVIHRYLAVYRDASIGASAPEAFRTAVSLDGVNWFDDRPLAQFGSTVVDTSGLGDSWNDGLVAPVEIFYNANGSPAVDLIEPWNNRFVMYYAAADGVGREAWGMALSADGRGWRGWQGGIPLFAAAGGEAWDANHVGAGTVIARPDGGYEAWYGGGNTAAGQGIGHATSSDGLTWTRCPANPILGLGGCGPAGGLGCAGAARDATSTANESPTAMLAIGATAGCRPALQYRLWRSGTDAGGVYRVAHSVMDSGLSSSANVLEVPDAYPTIQSALDAAQPGDTVLVAAGTYDENLVIDRPVHVIGEDRDTTIVRSFDGAGFPSAVAWIRGEGGSTGDCVKLENLTLDGVSADPQRAAEACLRTGSADPATNLEEAGWLALNSDLTVRNCRFRDARFRGAQVHGASGVRIEGCLVSGIGDTTIPQTDSFVGIEVLASRDVALTGNSVVLEDRPGATDVTGILVDRGVDVVFRSYQIENNSVVGPSRGGAIVLWGDGDDSVANHADPDDHLVAGNFVDGQETGSHGLVLGGGLPGVTVRDNELRSSAVNLSLSWTGTFDLPASVESNLIEGHPDIVGAVGVWLDDVAGDGTDELHVTMVGNTIRNHSGSGLFAVNKSPDSVVVIGSPIDALLANEFVDNCRYNVELDVTFGNPLTLPNELKIEADQNHWGVTCSPGVGESIFDSTDDPTLGGGRVTIGTWLDEKLDPVDPATTCAGPFSARTVTTDPERVDVESNSIQRFRFDVFAGEAPLESVVFRFPEEMAFGGFLPGELAGTWNVGSPVDATWDLVGLTSTGAFLDRDLDGFFGANDWLVLWSGRELQVSFGLTGPITEGSDTWHELVLDRWLFTNPADVGVIPISVTWRTRDGRLTCDTIQQSFVCRVSDAARIGTLRVVKHPSGVRAFWPALDPSGMPCFDHYSVFGSEDPSEWLAFSDRSSLDEVGTDRDTVFAGAMPDTFFFVSAMGPQGQPGPLRPDSWGF